MKRIVQRLEDIFAAVAFSEAAVFEHATALLAWSSPTQDYGYASDPPRFTEACP